MKQKIVLADDHQLLLEGIKTIIEEIEDTEVIATVNSGSALLGLLADQRVSLVILDLNMPGHDGLKCLHKIKRLYSSTKVLVLTSYDQPELIQQVKDLEAEGYMTKNASSAELKEAISCVLEGKKCYPSQDKRSEAPARSAYFVDDFQKKFHLTKREVEIIGLVCREMSSKEIAAALFLSEFTVNTHRKNILRKLDIKNVAGLVNFAKENGLL
jgi:DNA-binding NarL/FixJ family response regulator